MRSCAADIRAGRGFGVYVHWPFCLAKCPYCDFNSYVNRGKDDFERWHRGLLNALEAMAVLCPNRVVTSLFFGGGTPSLAPSWLIAAIIDRVAELWKMAENVEITLEANPTRIEHDHLAGFRDAGVGRLSLGIQALDDRALRLLGRNHDVAMARRALSWAQQLFPAVSCDLIYGRPYQSVDDWEQELDVALDLGVDHMSLYQLTLEPGTPFFALAERGALPFLDADASAPFQQLTLERMAAAGLPAYEVSNFARPGHECRHNLTYWHYGDWVGIGPGAHGRITHAQRGRCAVTVASDPARWLAMADIPGRPAEGITVATLTPAQQAEEYLVMALRTRDGFYPRRYAGYGGMLDTERLEDFCRDGFLERRGDGMIAATSKGFMVTNTLIAGLSI